MLSDVTVNHSFYALFSDHVYTCVYLLEKPFASELETHTNEINVSQVSATFYTFIAETLTFQKNGSVGAFCLTRTHGVVMLQNVYKFPYTASSHFSCAHSLIQI